MNQILAIQKFQKQAEEIGELRFADMESLFPFWGLHDTENVDFVHAQTPKADFDLEIGQNYDFVGRDRYLWLKKTVTIPSARDGYTPVGRFDFGLTGDGHNSGFESLLYVNGTPYQGVDQNHKEVDFSDYAGKSIELTFMLWTGLEGGGPRLTMEHRLKQAEIGYVHDAADDLYYLSKAIADGLEYISTNHPDREALIGAFEEALLVVDWDQEAFYDSAVEALRVFRNRISTIEKRDDKVTINCVGHTHIDVAWLWRLKHTREKAMRSFSTVLRFMNEYDDYRFVQSQPQLYKYIKKDNPELYEKIKKRVADGHWEADGGMWLEADCNISSGESLSRQFLHGTSFFRDEFGKKSEYLWLPDVFGYSWALPQIMKLCGIKTFMTTKISWNQYNTIPNDLFKWRGIDGTEVLTYFIDTPDESRTMENRYATYNGKLDPRTAIGSWMRFKNKELSNEVLVSYGFGDGGGGPTRSMIRLREVMDELPAFPAVKQTKPSEFFRRMHKNVETTDRPVQVWDGELYLEYHRGTYTTQGSIKKWNRVLENRLFMTEALSVMAELQGADYPVETLHDGWETVLRNQFHDIIPGSSIREVYEDAEIEYATADKAVAVVRQSALETLVVSSENAYTLFAPYVFSGQRLAFIPETRDGFFSQNGTVLSAQKTDGGYLVSVCLKGLALNTVEFTQSALSKSNSPFKVDKNSITTPFYNIRWTDNGWISEIYDTENKRQVLTKSGYGNALEVFEDKPLANENWDIEVYHTQKKKFFEPQGAPEVVEQGELYIVLRTNYAYHNSTVSQDMILYADNRRIDFKTHADWHEKNKLLKTAFELNIRTTGANYDIQYGYVQRPTHSNTSWDIARFEVVGHKWADLSESGYGVSLMNDCKYGYSAKDNTLRLTLLKSTKHPDTEADMGEHDFTYSLLPHIGRVDEGSTIEESTALNLPVQVVLGKAKQTESIVGCESKNIVVDAVKRAEDGNGYIVRLHECRGGSHEITLSTAIENCDITGCNILEESNGETYPSNNWTFALSPFEIKNFRIVKK